MRVLLVKLSSMGDLIHALPALTDAKKAIPNISFDWVVDENFSEIPLWHGSVNRVIKTAHRRWKKNVINSVKSGEFKKLWQELRDIKYDFIIDAQSNIKSSLVVRLAKGVRYGPDKAGVSEKAAHWAYQKTVSVPHASEAHAISRNRILLASVLGYEYVEDEPDFGIDPKMFPEVEFPLPEKYLIFVPSTTWVTKHWPLECWKDLAKRAADEKYNVLIPWGNENERQRAIAIASVSDFISVLPKGSISEIGYVLSKATGAICVDTGLGHLTAAMNIPAVHIYGPTSPKLIGATGRNQVHLQADFACAPCRQKQCTYKEKSEVLPACFSTVSPKLVWGCFLKQLHEAG
jgi:heptosyltransferase I